MMSPPINSLTIVISGVNLTEGGILSVLKDCLASFAQINRKLNARIIILVNSKMLVREYLDVFEVYEFPKPKQAWWRRLKFEFIDSYKLSKQFNPDLWISLHDITPNVICKYQVVYCHNPSPFYKLPLKEAFLNYRFTLFNIFYSYLYAINIKKNKFVIIQQDWLRNEFKRRYDVSTIVAYPEFVIEPAKSTTLADKKPFTFFYPSFPRVFKNFEIILKASELLSQKRQDFTVILTIDGTENRYSKGLLEKYSSVEHIEFIGLRGRDEIFEYYDQTDCLLFPSKLETWGLPLSEFKNFNKPIVVSDQLYAHETIGNYKKVKFFDPNNADQLCSLMGQIIDGQLTYDQNQLIIPNQPFFEKWDDLLCFLINKIN